MPQLDQLPLVYLSQWFWLAIVLITIFVVVGLWIVPKVESTVDDRDARIARDLEEAQRLQDQAEASEQAWRERMNAAHAEAQGATAAAKAKVGEKVDRQLAKVDAEIGERVVAAEAELDAARRSALAELELLAAEAAQDIVARLAGAKVSAADARRAVAGAMANA
jgi:F-type H+-transporting ATPase subunit b